MAPFFLVFSKKSLDQLSLEQNFSFTLEGGGGGGCWCSATISLVPAI